MTLIKLGKFVQGSNRSCMNEISLGPWGYHTAEEWSFKPKGGAAIKQIIIRYGGIIDSIMFKTDAGDYSTKFGGDGGGKTVKIDVDYPAEYLTGISGTHGKYWSYGYVVCSLSFQTNRSKYGPFGSSGSGTGFSVNANDGVITGFHGRCGKFLEAIGVYVMPVCCSHPTEIRKTQLLNSDQCASSSSLPPLSLTRGAGPIGGGGGGRDWDDGVFSAVKGVRVRVRIDTGFVSSVRFSYLKSDGSDFLSPFHGGDCGGHVRGKTVAFDEEDEYLIGVEGFYGVVAQGLTAITSLTFVTNKARYGPVGDEIGTFFTFMNSDDCNRRVVGFHGRSGAYLDAIGIHAEYLDLNH